MTLIPTISIAGFGCPCHGGQYDTEGNRTAGPPVRALDRYSFSIRNGNLFIGKPFSVAKVDGTGAHGEDPQVDVRLPRRARRRPRVLALSDPASPLMATRSKPTKGSQLQQAILYPLDWLEERSGLVGGVKYFLFRKVPGDVNWFQTLGSATLHRVPRAGADRRRSSRCTTSPTRRARTRRSSTSRTTSGRGWLVRGMHRWGASVFIILMFMHMGRVFLFGAYKYPRELNWIIGVLLLAMGLGEGFTGYLLPWDQTAYWATIVGININGTAPILGPFLAQFLQGGTTINADTLSRFYAIHMLLIPGAIFALIGLHLYLVVRLGVTSPPWSKEAAGTGPIAKAPENGGRRSGLTRYSAERPLDDAERPHHRAPPRLPAVQGGRQGAREAVLPVRHVARHDHVVRRHRGDHRPGGRLEVLDAGRPPHHGAGLAREALRRPRRPRHDQLRPAARIGTSTSSSTCCGSSSGPTRCCSARSASRRSLLVLLLAMPFIDLRPERRLLAPARGDRRLDSRRPLDGRPHVQGRDREGGARLGDDARTSRSWAKQQGFQNNPAAIAGAQLFAVSGCLNCHVYLGDGGQNLGAPELTAEGAKNKGIAFQIAHLQVPGVRERGLADAVVLGPRRRALEAARDLPRSVQGPQVASSHGASRVL